MSMPIDGMAKILYNNNRVGFEIIDAVEISTALYNEGYRHQSDTAREILEELEAELAECDCFDNVFAGYIRLTIEQLRVKYVQGCEGLEGRLAEAEGRGIQTPGVPGEMEEKELL